MLYLDNDSILSFYFILSIRSVYMFDVWCWSRRCDWCIMHMLESLNWEVTISKCIFSIFLLLVCLQFTTHFIVKLNKLFVNAFPFTINWIETKIILFIDLRIQHSNSLLSIHNGGKIGQTMLIKKGERRRIFKYMYKFRTGKKETHKSRNIEWVEKGNFHLFSGYGARQRRKYSSKMNSFGKQTRNQGNLENVHFIFN